MDEQCILKHSIIKMKKAICGRSPEKDSQFDHWIILIINYFKLIMASPIGELDKLVSKTNCRVSKKFYR